MRKVDLDHEEKIYYLTLIIKSLCEENKINKMVVVEDFIETMGFKIYEEKYIHRYLSQFIYLENENA